MARTRHLKGNYFHDNGDSAGGLVDAGDGDNTTDREQRLGLHLHLPLVDPGCATDGSTFRHNTFAGGGGLHFYMYQSGYPAGNLIRDNVFTNAGNGITWDSSGADWGTQDHNLNAGVPGRGNLKGRPVFVGGKKPKSYQGYRLARGSRGKGAASDGGDLGIRARR